MVLILTPPPSPLSWALGHKAKVDFLLRLAVWDLCQQADEKILKFGCFVNLKTVSSEQ